MRGNKGNAPLKVLDESGDQRFRFVPLKRILKATSARPAALPLADFSNSFAVADAEDVAFSHLADTLATESDNNITASFTAYASQLRPLSHSLPLVYRNRRRIFDISAEALVSSAHSNWDSTISVTRCIAALSKDLSTDHFLPFFGPLVQNLASIFTAKIPSADNDSRNQRNVAASLWDPEASLVPIFSLLTTVSKALLQKLTQQPTETVQQLLPLLAVPVARVREMTAEACVGYVLRKTRDVSAARAFTVALCLAPSNVSTDLQSDNLLDGLGTALFEAMRQPQKRLHARANSIMKDMLFAIRDLETSESPASTMKVLPHNQIITLTLISNCLKKVLRHVGNVDDLWKLAAALMHEGEEGRKNGDTVLVSCVLYIFKNWLQHRGRRFCDGITNLNSQKLRNFFTKCLETFTSDPQVAYEAFGALFSLCTQLDFAEEQAAVYSISRAIMIIEKSSNDVSASQALCVLLHVLRDPTNQYSSVVEASLPVIARLHNFVCHRGKLSEEHVVLLSGVLLSLLKKSCKPSCSFVNLNFPILQEVVRNILSRVDNSGNISLTRVPLVSVCLDILKHLRMKIVDPVICDLLKSGRDSDFKPSETSALLQPATFQLFSAISNSEVEIKERTELEVEVKSAVSSILQHGSSYNISTLRSLNRFFKAFHSEALSLLSEGSLSFDGIIDRLTQNLISSELSIRVASADLLALLTASHVQPHDPPLFEDVSDVVSSLWKSPENQYTLAHGLYRCAMRLLRTSSSFEVIGENQRILSEIIRMANSRKLNDAALKVLAYLSIGILRTPLRTAWESAGVLWHAVASKNSDLMMEVSLDFICECVNTIAPLSNTGAQNSGSTTFDSDKQDLPEKQQSNVSAHLDSDETEKGIDNSISPTMVPSSSTDIKHWNPEEFLYERSSIFSCSTEYLPLLGDNEGIGYGKDISGLISSVIKLLSVMSKDARFLLKYRARLVDIYVRLSRKGNTGKTYPEITAAIINVLESSGGLKCTEADKELEKVMRFQLIRDITRPHANLQKSAVRCICASRSPLLKPHRESLIRLIDDESFREELALLTESLVAQNGSSMKDNHESNSEDELVDVISRICFSKFSGRHGQSRQGGILTFLMSRLPAGTVIRKLVDLALDPLKIELDSLNLSRDSVSPPVAPPISAVQRGMLSTLEALLKYCRRSIPLDSWKIISSATFCIFRNACGTKSNNRLFSSSLLMLAEMYRIRAAETEFVIPSSLMVLRERTVAPEKLQRDVRSTSVLTLVESLFTFGSSSFLVWMMKKHGWIVQECIQVMSDASALDENIVLSMSIAKRLAELMSQEKRDVETQSMACVEPKQSQLIALSATSVGLLLRRMTQLMDSSTSSRRTWVPVFNDALDLLSLLTKLSTSSAELVPLGTGLCALLEKGGIHFGYAKNAFLALLAITQRLSKSYHGNGTTNPQRSEMVDHEEWIFRLASLLLRSEFLSEHEAYAAFCELLGGTGLCDLREVSGILKDFSAMDSSRIDYADFDKRIEALNRILVIAKAAIGDDNSCEGTHALIIHGGQNATTAVEGIKCGLLSFICMFYSCIAVVRSDDIAVRGTAGYCLSSLAKWAGLNTAEGWKRTSMITFSALVKHSATAKNIEGRREYCRALGEFLRNSMKRRDHILEEWNEGGISKAMEMLVNVKDPEADCLENIVHLQAHRRSRALRHIMKILNRSRLEDNEEKSNPIQLSEFASLFAVPLSMSVALEKADRGSSSKKRPRIGKQAESRASAENDVQMHAVELVGCSTCLLDWSDFRSFFSSILRKIKNEQDEDVLSILERILVSSSRTFVLRWKSEGPEREEVTKYIAEKALIEMLRFVSFGAVEGRILNAEKAAESGSRRKGKGERKSPTVFRGNVAKSIGQVLICLPKKELETKLPLVIAPIGGALRSRMISVRGEGNRALVGVVLSTGDTYFDYILRQVLESLTEGFRRDTCVHVIEVALRGIAEANKSTYKSSGSSFCVDHACRLIVEYLCKEVVESIAESKADFLDPNATSSREKQATTRATKVAECVELLVEQLQHEESVVMVGNGLFNLMKQHGSAKLRKRVWAALQRALVGLGRNSHIGTESRLKYCYTLVSNVQSRDEAAFGLQLLNSVLSKQMNVLKGNGDDSRKLHSMCKPFVDHTTQALGQADDEVRLYALRTAQKLMKLPGVNKKEMWSKVSETVIETLSKGGSGAYNSGDSEQLLTTCLRSGAILLGVDRGHGDVERARVETLVKICLDCIEQGSMEVRSGGIALLRAIVSSKIIVPGVYDAMERVNKLAIHSQSSSLRKACINLSIDFMVSFPLGSKRVRQHMEFFVRNLAYKQATGRQAALHALTHMMQRVPQEFLSEEAEYIFMGVAAVSGGDADGQCREMALKCMSELIKRVEQAATLMVMARGLCKSEDEDVRYSGVMAVTIGVQNGTGTVAASLELMKDIWSRCSGWQSRYAILRCVEACLQRQPDADKQVVWVWAQLPALLVDRRQWIRSCGNRLLTSHLAHAKGRKSNVWSVWSCAVLTRQVLKAVCMQLEADELKMSEAESAVRILVCMGRTVHGGGVGDVRDNGEHSESGECRCGWLDSSREEDTERRCWRWLMGRMCGMGMRGNGGAGGWVRRACGVRFLVEAGPWGLSEHAKSVGGVVVKIADGREEEDDGVRGVRLVGAQLDAVMKKELGADAWYAACNEARSARNRRSSKRRGRPSADTVACDQKKRKLAPSRTAGSGPRQS